MGLSVDMCLDDLVGLPHPLVVLEDLPNGHLLRMMERRKVAIAKVTQVVGKAGCRNPGITRGVPAVNHIPIEAQHGAFQRFQTRCSRSDRPECSYHGGNHLSTAVKALQAECAAFRIKDPLIKGRTEKLVPLFQRVIDVVAKEAGVPTLRVRAVKGSMCDVVVGRGGILLEVTDEPGQGGEVLACLVQSAAAAYHSPVATFAFSLCATQLSVSGFIFRDQVYYGPLLSIDLASDTAGVAWVLESMVLGALDLEKEREKYEESGYDTHYTCAQWCFQTCLAWHNRG
ncbi:hypothetical protein KIPB_013684 [Kipferlia bialata]|uniref:Uncharacterized protein n=1 Tax=Kipferlia bialata TaxID=797122 RepID=A0A391NSQ0_9EUKA|nr:hypothetical protein KIPB_013684 [Kipferlia bialata]|eukprot:g13684.t1